MPLVELMLRPATAVAQESVITSNPKLCWRDVTPRQVISYNESVRFKLEPLLHSIINSLQVACAGTCHDETHIDNVIHCYEALTVAIIDSGVRCFEHKENNTLGHTNIIPGWNESVKVRHKTARMAFLHWRADVSPKEGYLSHQMRQTRLSFKYALRKCKRERSMSHVNKIAVSLLNKEHDRFWALVKRQLGGGSPLPPSVGGITGNTSIANMWAEHFKVIFNDISCASDNDFLVQITREPSADVPSITTADVSSALSKLKCGKSAGWDLMSAEHVMYLQPDVLSVIAVLLNSILNHGFVPDGLVFSLLLPLIKNKNGALDDKSNYRAIALSTTLSKVLELILVERLQPFLNTSDAQFGFKPGHSTTLATFVLKETIDFYTKQGSPVYVCFLDASKAFDRICHSKLFQILSERGVPKTYLKLLIHWYRFQKMGVKWADKTSHSFSVANGVRQGGNLSPLLFNVYMDDLLHSLRMMRVGCHIQNTPVNALAYAVF